MQVISKQKALEMLRDSIQQAPQLPLTGTGLAPHAPWVVWIQTLRHRIQVILPADSPQAMEIDHEIKRIEQSPIVERESLMQYLGALLQACYNQIQDLWNDEPDSLGVPKSQPTEPVTTCVGERVFVVHGHDHGRMQEVARFIEQLGMKAVILHEQASAGNTVIEKLEAHGQADYCVVLLTPDDVGAASSDRANVRPRARQNVVLELGYFMGKLGRRRTCALKVGDIEIPTDFSGVVYISLDTGGAWRIELAKELQNAGLPIVSRRLL